MKSQQNLNYAVIQTGGKQYKVSAGDVIDIELIDIVDEESSSNEIKFTEVLFVKSDNESKVGAPFVEGAVVNAELLDFVRGPKVISYKYKKRKNFRKKIGHRQNYFRVKIKDLIV